jgi:TolB-like protein
MSLGPSFWDQLKERKVVRVALLYGAVAWALVEAADLLGGILALPNWTAQLVLLLLALGFPLAVALAWAFDVTPAGVRRAEPVSTGAFRAGLLAAFVSASVLWASAIGVWWLSSRDRGPDDRRTPLGQPTVAVLPLENRSSVPDQRYFVDGLHDELITQLSRIEDLAVTSRTSVMEYRDGGSVREIGQALGVGAIVEGGVERVGDRIRVIVQLIDTETDAHLFGQTYDEVLTTENLFEIRSDLTLRIAAALHAALTPDETRRIRAVPTGNLDAYDLVLRGRDLYEGGPEDVEKALEFFAQATKVAPDYADAWAWLGMAYQQRAQKGGYGPEMRDSARVHARQALRVDPENAMAYRLLGDYERALALRPNWEVVLISLSTRAWWSRQHAQGLRLIARARKVAPTDPLVAEHVADHTYYLLLDEEHRRWMDEVRRMDPDYYWLAVFEALYAAERLEFAAAEQALSIVRRRDPGDPQVHWLEMRLGLGQRDSRRVEDAARALVTDHPDWDWWGQQVQSRVLLAWALLQQDRADEVGDLLTEALLRADAALERDSATSPQVLYASAQALMLQGLPADALLRLLDAVTAGYPNYRMLQIDPTWDTVRNDPRFLEAVRVVDEDLARQRVEMETFLPTIP